MDDQVLHIYCRVSTRIQETDGTSLETQQDLGIKKAEELGYKHKLWNEGAKSSHHEDITARPILSALLTDIRDGKVKHLWVIENSRLSRNDMVASTIRYEMNKAGVILYTKDGRYDLNNPSDTFTRQILDATSQLENALRTERSRLGKLQKARMGQWHGGAPPYGYEIKEKRLQPHEEESKWVKRIFQEYSSGTTMMDIKTLLDTNGVQPRRKGSTWALGSLQALVSNTHYIGRYTYTDSKTDESVEVECPKIVSASVWQKCNVKKRKTRERKGQINRTKHFYLLRDIMFCGHCGTPMGGRINKGAGHNWYYCPAPERKWESVSGSNKGGSNTNKTKKWERGRHCSMTRSLNIDETDKIVWKSIVEIVSESNFLKQRMKDELLKDKSKSDDEYKKDLQNSRKRERSAVKNLKRVEESIAKIETDRLLERMDADLFKQVRKNLEDERNKALAEVETTRDALNDVSSKKRWIDWVGKFKETYEDVEHLTPEQRKEYLEGILSRIDVRLDDDSNDHLISLVFQYPIVGDSYRNQKVIDGERIRVVRGLFAGKRRPKTFDKPKKKAMNTES